MEDKAEFATDFVLLEHLLARHEVDHLELHQERVEELGVAAMEYLPTGRTLLDDASILAI
jgi:hypothetical protein